jgi:hypothetical protein
MWGLGKLARDNVTLNIYIDDEYTEQIPSENIKYIEEYEEDAWI